MKCKIPKFIFIVIFLFIGVFGSNSSIEIDNKTEVATFTGQSVVLQRDVKRIVKSIDIPIDDLLAPILTNKMNQTLTDLNLRDEYIQQTNISFNRLKDDLMHKCRKIESNSTNSTESTNRVKRSRLFTRIGCLFAGGLPCYLISEITYAVNDVYAAIEANDKKSEMRGVIMMDLADWERRVSNLIDKMMMGRFLLSSELKTIGINEENPETHQHLGINFFGLTCSDDKIHGKMEILTVEKKLIRGSRRIMERGEFLNNNKVFAHLNLPEISVYYDTNWHGFTGTDCKNVMFGLQVCDDAKAFAPNCTHRTIDGCSATLFPIGPSYTRVDRYEQFVSIHSTHDEYLLEDTTNHVSSHVMPKTGRIILRLKKDQKLIIGSTVLVGDDEQTQILFEAQKSIFKYSETVLKDGANKYQLIMNGDGSYGFKGEGGSWLLNALKWFGISLGSWWTIAVIVLLVYYFCFYSQNTGSTEASPDTKVQTAPVADSRPTTISAGGNVTYNVYNSSEGANSVTHPNVEISVPNPSTSYHQPETSSYLVPSAPPVYKHH